METMERIWQTLFRRKKKKYATSEPETGEAADSGRGDQLSVENLGPISDQPQTVTVKTAGGELFTRNKASPYRAWLRLLQGLPFKCSLLGTLLSSLILS